MKNIYNKTGRVILTAFLVLALFSCNKDDDGSLTVKTGDWSGTDIALQ